MAEIRLADHAGFCFGVRNALEKTEKLLDARAKTPAGASESRKERSIYSCGSLIHNRFVIEDLKTRGLQVVKAPEEAERGSVLLIRAHGEAADFYDRAAARDLELHDLTCPFVARIHTLVRNASEAGDRVIIAGDCKHPEVIGIRGWVLGEGLVAGSPEEAEELGQKGAFAEGEWTAVAQTTLNQELWDSILDVLKRYCGGRLTVHNTICSATEQRQEGCRKLSEWAELMVVIGDRESSNTKKLYEIAKKNCKNVIFTERKTDLPLKDIKKYSKIGVAAGASTPERIIKEVISAMSEAITEKKELEQVEVETVVVEDFAAEEPVKEPEVVTDAVEEEINDMQNLMDQIEKSLRLPGRGEIVEGEIVQVTQRYVVVNLGCKKDGVIPKDELTLEDGQELTEAFKEGDTIQAKVLKTDDGDGNILLSKKKLEVNEHWDEITVALDNKEVVNAKVVKEVKGGVIAVYKEVSGFIPMSQLSDRYVEKADEFIGKVLPVKVTRVDQKRNKAVFSHKAYLEEEKKKRLQEIWESLQVGDVVEGTVMRFTDYGAFVDIGGIDGLLHISEISWGKLKHPQEALTIGQQIPVKILSMNSEKGKISLGLKQNRPEPWSVIDEKYQAGQVIEGKVVQIKEYGAFVELEPGLDGLVHISEIAFKRVTNINDELTIGQNVQAEILEIDKERKRISLSIKKALPAEAAEEVAEAVEE
ncbi:MAG: bifunctional 4-hydroxy-3-methylbut-2-enyl diphosphate reductase/30S ribosomal protein S1 [Clostridiales bacterium]|nr:bifunctional 4-hydroxy-3-methylbut-2-enyl diphosphate reductase/30S ribosomal protein S1 [Clostridiales bacterium]